MSVVDPKFNNPKFLVINVSAWALVRNITVFPISIRIYLQARIGEKKVSMCDAKGWECDNSKKFHLLSIRADKQYLYPKMIRKR